MDYQETIEPENNLTKEFEIIDGEDKYKLKIETENNNIIFKLIKVSEISLYDYVNVYKYEKLLKEMQIISYKYDSISEIYDYLKEFKIIRNNNDKRVIKLIINNKHEINLTERKNENILENIVSKLNELIKINEDKDKIIQNLINENNNLKNELKIIKNENNNLIENIRNKLNEKFGINFISEVNDISSNNKADGAKTIKEIEDKKKISEHKNNKDEINLVHNDNNKDEINILYKIDKEEIKLFGKKFVENNKNNCSIIIDGIEQELVEDYKFENFEKKGKDILEIKLKGISNITNLNYMFWECDSLISFPDISNLDTSKVTNMNHIFDVQNLKWFPNISNWNISNALDIGNDILLFFK